MATSDVDPVSGPSKGGFRQSVDDFCTFIYNGETGEICGRTGKSWALITIFYIVFYGFLSSFFIATIAVFYTTVDEHSPVLQGGSSLLKDSPGLGYRPRPNYESTLIRFNKGDASMDKYVNNIKSFLSHYNTTKYDSRYENCETISGERETNKHKPCLFDPLALQAPCLHEPDYGYKNGTPCVLLKLNKIFDWIPRPYTNETVPVEAKDNWDNYHITVKCHGERQADIENLGPVNYYPKHGFPIKYFPFLNQPGYHAPIVVVQFMKPTRGFLVMVECKAYAENIVIDKLHRLGLVHFELLVD
uniref:Na+/K+ ATPase beta subunit n=1 Tax=Doryteuthis pealeii TaxID=1051067 RepID=A4LAB0_DORPE|nr:Na+/K+ ATPase beta subunit [Doryteuthis pealeii]